MGVFLGFAVSGFLALALSSKLAGMWPPSVVQPEKFTAFLFGVLAFHGVAIPSIAYFLWDHDRSWREAFDIPGPEPGRTILYGILGAIIIIPLAYGLQWVCGWLIEFTGHKIAVQDTIEILQRERVWFVRGAFFVFAVVIAPLVEECLFRGIFFSALRDRGYRKAAYLVSAVVFGAIHMNLVAFLPLALFGLIQAWMYERSGSLLTPIITHSLFNALPFVLLHFGLTDQF
ncbi:MAG TPA: CPBP family intramembrane glutamic endopeptidase [Candidatus Limnocylindria bacterium]|jgi:membrane protease YdiL (CAAX protease family)|nr:CPBP family intramembrane glutamic endopeptidase [Candidatus Limnocylindria bacterium]